jgi:hypothetical protein
MKDDITAIQPWERVSTTGESRYYISVIRGHRPNAAEPHFDQWDFGGNREMWLQVIEIMVKYSDKVVSQRDHQIRADEMNDGSKSD